MKFNNLYNRLMNEGRTAAGYLEVQLKTAIKNNDVNKIKELIADGLDLTKYGEYPFDYKNIYSAFEDAILYGSKDVVKFLLDLGLDAKNNNNSPLIYAIDYINGLHTPTDRRPFAKEIVKMLIDDGADVNTVIGTKKDSLIMRLIDRGSTIDYQTRLDLLNMLIDSGADVNHKNMYASTALFMSVEKNDLEASKILLDAGADVNARNISGDTVLSIAKKSMKFNSPLTKLIQSKQ